MKQLIYSCDKSVWLFPKLPHISPLLSVAIPLGSPLSPVALPDIHSSSQVPQPHSQKENQSSERKKLTPELSLQIEQSKDDSHRSQINDIFSFLHSQTKGGRIFRRSQSI